MFANDLGLQDISFDLDDLGRRLIDLRWLKPQILILAVQHRTPNQSGSHQNNCWFTLKFFWYMSLDVCVLWNEECDRSISGPLLRSAQTKTMVTPLDKGIAELVDVQKICLLFVDAHDHQMVQSLLRHGTLRGVSKNSKRLKICRPLDLELSVSAANSTPERVFFIINFF